MPNGQISREQLLSRQDILNIQHQLNVESIQKHTNDLLSTCAWVNEMQTMQYNPVVLFKQQGVEQTEDMNDLGKNDFLLVLQTEFQKDAMKRCYFITHGTTQYDFQLIWRIDNKGNQYTLEILRKECSCQLYCSMCKACIHMYSCTCMDATIHNTVCKHAHFLHMSIYKDVHQDDSKVEHIHVANSDEDMIVEDVEGIEINDCESEPEKEVHNNHDQMKPLEFNTQEYFSHVLQADLITDLTTCKSNVEDLTHKIQSLVQPCNDINTLTTVKQHLQSAISVLEAKHLYPKEDHFTPTITPAPNSNHEKQTRFFSTKSKRKITSKRWAKPSKDEVDEVKSKLMNSGIKICGKHGKRRTLAIMTLKYHGFSVTFVSFGFMSPVTLTVKLIWKDNIYVGHIIN